MDKRKKKKEAKSVAVVQIKQPGSGADTGGGDDFPDHALRVQSNISGGTDTLKLERGPYQREIEGSEAARTLEIDAGVSNDRKNSEVFVSRMTEDEESTDWKIVLENVEKQKHDVQIVANLVKKQTHVLKKLIESGRPGRCPRCAFQEAVKEAYETEDDVELTEAKQCTDDLAVTSGVVKITVLLNDGKTINLDSDFCRGDSGVLSGYESVGRVDDTMDTGVRIPGATSRSYADLYQPDGLGWRGTVDESDGDTIRDFAFDDDGQTRHVNICPICEREEFYTIEDLRIHVEGHFVNREMSEDYIP